MSELDTFTDELRPIFNQTRVEHEMLDRAKEALLAALEWKTEGPTFTRKLSSVRFAAHTLQQHLDRILAIEECDGYMDLITEECPHLSEKVSKLELEHDEFRNSMNAIITKLDRLIPTDTAGLEATRLEINDLLRRFKDHSDREIDLLQGAMNDDLGHGD